MTSVDGRFAPVVSGLEEASHTDMRLRLTSNFPDDAGYGMTNVDRLSESIKGV